MKRLHVHVAVESLSASIRFYSELFGAAPTVTKPDYAKWMLEDPRVNFAISARSSDVGISHLGIQSEDPDELADVYARLVRADRAVLDEGATTCCYAKSEKRWIEDPQGVRWEAFLTVGDSTTYGGELASGAEQACCVPKGTSARAQAGESCCTPSERASAVTACCA